MSEWVDLKKRRPPMMSDVIFVCDGEMFVGCMESAPEEDPVFWTSRSFDSEKITHWMPLPEFHK